METPEFCSESPCQLGDLPWARKGKKQKQNNINGEDQEARKVAI